MDRDITILKYGFNPNGNKSNNNSSSISLDNYVNNLKTFTRKEPDKVLNIIDNKTATDVVDVKSLNIQQVSTNEQQPTKFAISVVAPTILNDFVKANIKRNIPQVLKTDSEIESTDTSILTELAKVNTLQVSPNNLILSSVPTYTLTSSVASTNEGPSVTITLNTTNVANGTVLPYTITGVTTNDIGGGSLTGNFTINSGTDTITINVAADLITEGTETLTLSLDNGQASVSVIINDTSVEPPLQGLLNAWYDAADSSTIITDGSNNVTAWNDKGIYGNHLTNTPTTKPTYNTRTFNGKNVVDFSGTTYMRRYGMTIPKSNLSWYIVCQVDSVSTFTDCILGYTGVTTEDSWQIRPESATQFRGSLVRGTAGTFRDTTYYGPENKIGDYHLFQIAFDDDNQEDSIFLNGVFKEIIGNRSPILQNLGSLVLFANRSVTTQPSGAVAEVICVNSVLTETRQKIEAHLAWKWGIQSKLPANHPYKTSGSPFTNFPNS